MLNRIPYYGDCDDLIDMLDFEDTKSIIVENEICFDQFISGEWYTADGNNYFKANLYYLKTENHYYQNKEGHCAYNLPSFKNPGGYYKIMDGVYYEGKKGAENQKQFKFSIVDKNTISIYCYKNNKNYTLYRR